MAGRGGQLIEKDQKERKVDIVLQYVCGQYAMRNLRANSA